MEKENRIKIGIVVPSSRPESLEKWKEEWKPILEEKTDYEATLYVVEDKKETWDQIKDELTKNAWIIPVKTDCIRSYGYYQAYRDKQDVLMTFDDDVYPIDNPIRGHLQQLGRVVEPLGWHRTLRGTDAPFTRGLPEWRKVVLNHGLWTGTLDLSAHIQLSYQGNYQPSLLGDDFIVPHGYFPMSGMNLAWRREITPGMYFGLQGYDIHDPRVEWGLHRCGDIMAGVFIKTILDNGTQGLTAVHSGAPFVHHTRASDPHVNLRLESSSLPVPHILARTVAGSRTYREVAERVTHCRYPSRRYNQQLGKAMRIWEEMLS